MEEWNRSDCVPLTVSQDHGSPHSADTYIYNQHTQKWPFCFFSRSGDRVLHGVLTASPHGAGTGALGDRVPSTWSSAADGKIIQLCSKNRQTKTHISKLREGICGSARTRKVPRHPKFNLIKNTAWTQVCDHPAQTLTVWTVSTRHHSCVFWHPWWKWAENLTVPYQEVFLLVLMRLKYLVPQMSGLAPAAWEIANYCSVSLIFWFN